MKQAGGRTRKPPPTGRAKRHRLRSTRRFVRRPRSLPKRLSHLTRLRENAHVPARRSCELGRIGTPRLRIHENKKPGDQAAENAEGHIEPQRKPSDLAKPPIVAAIRHRHHGYGGGTRFCPRFEMAYQPQGANATETSSATLPAQRAVNAYRSTTNILDPQTCDRDQGAVQ